MSTIGDSVGRAGRLDVGMGYSVPPELPEEPLSVAIESFAGGIDKSEPLENTPANSAVHAVDMEITKDDALIRSPGISQLQQMSPRVMRYLFEQVNVDYASELIAIDPPHFCAKSTGVMVCSNLAIAATGAHGWNAVNVIDRLLFSNGSTVSYTRLFGVMAVVNVSAQIIARTFATIFGRVFAGAIYFRGGTFQALGIAWNAASGNPADWTATGSGAELLIADQQEADKVVALRSIGFDMLGILNRHSLWAGYPTGDSLRPADFRPRVMGVGCVSEPTAVTTPMGITFLSDDGVVVFNGNDVALLSKQINSELLPIDYTRLGEYIAIYDSQLNRYILATPFGIWIYEFPSGGRKGRWLFKSVLVNALIHFSAQSGGFPWDQSVGSWDAEPRTWADMVQLQSDAPGLIHYGIGTVLGTDSPDSLTYLGAAMLPIWRTPFAARDKVTEQFTTLGFEVTYSALAVSTITLKITDSAGVYAGGTIQKILPATAGVQHRAIVNKLMTGMNAAVEISINDGKPKIYRVRQIVRPVGPRNAAL